MTLLAQRGAPLRRAAAVALLFLSAAAAPAQTDSARTDAPPGPASRPAGPRGAGDVDALARRLTSELGLTAPQIEQLRQLVAQHHADEGRIRDLQSELRAAERAGDAARADELRRELGPDADAPRDPLGRFLARLRAILTPGQAELLDRIAAADRSTTRPGSGEAYVLERLRASLRLRPEQDARYVELMNTVREDAELIRPLLNEMRAARRQRDRARIAELQKQLDKARQSRQERLEAFFAGVEAILDEPQRATLLQFKTRFLPSESAEDTLEHVIRAARRLELTEEQSARLRELIAELPAEARDGEGTDEAADRELARTLRSEVRALLAPEQVEEFEATLERLRRQSGPQAERAAERRRARRDRP